MDDVAQKLRKARALIGRGWTQGALARNAKGGVISSSSIDAVCWCIVGAVCAACSTLTEEMDLFDVLEEVTRSRTGYVAEWNDAPERTQTEVIAAFDKAIQLAEQESA